MNSELRRGERMAGYISREILFTFCLLRRNGSYIPHPGKVPLENELGYWVVCVSCFDDAVYKS
jgi:hypothetical protein